MTSLARSYERAQPGTSPEARHGAPTSVEASTLGGTLRFFADELRDLAERTCALADESKAVELTELIHGIGSESSRIAIIGQVKAGKSSLVNALVRRPGLLPTDVNPWTSVVTSLHFGKRSKEGPAAVFTFFDDEDWDHLASGGRLHELTSRLGVPLNQDLLTRQVLTMRAMAEARLGPMFHHLLGKQHRFATMSSEILARYICVGDLDNTEETLSKPAAGRFSDVTKSAELSFEETPFAYPTTIVDTPGTNDPFLVRNEITRTQLEKADVYIVVLTAQQALSTADLDLLRLLHGLHKQRLVVFINRIDLLADVSGDADRVANHTRARLAEEFPHVVIPVIVGSAHWGETGLDLDRMAALGHMPPSLLAFAEHRGIPARSESSSPEDLGATFMACSGVLDLEVAVESMLLKGPAMLALQRTWTSLAAILTGMINAEQSEIRTLGRLTLNPKQRSELSGPNRRALQTRIDQFEALPTKMAAIAEALRQDLDIVRDIALQSLRIALSALVSTFAEEQGNALRAQLQRNENSRVWRCETHQLRSQMESLFLDSYRESMDQCTKTERSGRSSLESEIRKVLPDYRLENDDRPKHMIDPLPSISALGQAVALDLGDQWGQWWRRWRSDDQRVRHLEKLVLAEFAPVASTLVESAEAELDSHLAITTHRFARICKDLEVLLERQRTHVEEAVRSVSEDAEALSTANQEMLREEALKCAKIRLQTYEAIMTDLRKLEAVVVQSIAGYVLERPS
ncbi:MAG: dynamin family protein [Hyphomicrobiales bacterium]